MATRVVASNPALSVWKVPRAHQEALLRLRASIASIQVQLCSECARLGRVELWIQRHVSHRSCQAESASTGCCFGCSKSRVQRRVSLPDQIHESIYVCPEQ